MLYPLSYGGGAGRLRGRAPDVGRPEGHGTWVGLSRRAGWAAQLVRWLTQQAAFRVSRRVRCSASGQTRRCVVVVSDTGGGWVIWSLMALLPVLLRGTYVSP